MIIHGYPLNSYFLSFVFYGEIKFLKKNNLTLPTLYFRYIYNGGFRRDYL